MTINKPEILEAEVSQRDVAQIYDRIAPMYDLWGRLTESKARARCLELAAIQDGEAVLEVAAGTGLAFEQILLANPTGQNDGVDLSEEMLSRAAEKAAHTGLGNYRLRVGNAYALDFDSEAFDVVVNNYMFDLLPERDFALVLSEFKRVLRPGGRLVMVNMARAERWYQSIWEGVYRVNPAWLGGCRGVHLVPYLESAGFEGIRRESVSQMTFPSEVVCAWKPASASDKIRSEPVKI